MRAGDLGGPSRYSTPIENVTIAMKIAQLAARVRIAVSPEISGRNATTVGSTTSSAMVVTSSSTAPRVSAKVSAFMWMNERVSRSR